MVGFSFAPTGYALRRLTGRSTSLRAQGAETVEVAPAGTLAQKPPIHLPDELDRVQRVTSHSTIEIERRRLFGPEIEYPATTVTRLTDVIIDTWNVYSGGARGIQHKSARWRPVSVGEFLEIDEAMLCCTGHSNRFFGHWLTDQLATELLAADLGVTATHCAPSGAAGQDHGHATEYRNLAGIASYPVHKARIATLQLPRDVGQNSSRRERQLRIRHNLSRHALPSTGTQDASLVYLGRGSQGSKRSLLNDAEVRAWITANAGVVVEPEQTAVQDLQAVLGRADCVVGVEGSALAHAVMLMPPTATLVVIQPPGRFHNILKTYTDAVGQRYAFTVANSEADGFTLRVERLARLLEAVKTI